jgi:hypothetical protein
MLLQVLPAEFRGVDISHSKHNPAWNEMKLSMLAKQLRRFMKFGIVNAEVRLGFFEDYREMSLENALGEIEKWTKQHGEVADGEINVKPCLPISWDGGDK